MNRTHLQNIQLFVAEMALLSLLVVSCGGSSDDPLKTQDSPIFPPIVFIADKDLGGVDELYASFDDGTEIVKLSNALVAGGNVVAFLVSPDGFFVAYVADQDTDGVFELYTVVVDKTAGDTAVKVSEPMAGSGVLRLPSGEYSFGWAPDSSRVAYLADQSTANVIELYTNLPEGSSNINVSGELAFDREVEEFSWAPNSSRIGYTAKQVGGSNILNLFSALPGVSRSSTQISSGLTPGQVVESFKWSPNNDRIAFITDRNFTEFFRLFSAPVGGTSNVEISATLDAETSDVRSFKWSSGGSRIAYVVAIIDLTDSVFELYSTLPDDNLSTLISNDLEDDNDTGFGWAPNGSRLAYMADQAGSDDFELYTTKADGSDARKVSGPLVTDGDVQSFMWKPDSAQIAYSADQETDEIFELYVSPSDSSAGNIKVSGTDMIGGGIFDFAWSRDSSRLAYIADQDATNIFELYSSTPDGSDNDILSGMIVSGGDVQDFKWASDSSGVAYLADQDINNVIELYASQPNGNNNTKLSGTLVNGGDVFSFDWVP